jgi:hypothetical protein
MNKSDAGCCSCGSGCCGQEQKKRQIIIDFLYLDLSVCKRCQGTETNLEDAVNEVSTILRAAGFDIVLNKINLNFALVKVPMHLENSIL